MPCGWYVSRERPYTFVVLALLVLIMSAVAISTTPTDIFPNINIPVVAVDWTYAGLNPEQLEGRLTGVYEHELTATVDNIQHRVNHGQRMQHMTADVMVNTMVNTEMFYAPDACDRVVALFRSFGGAETVLSTAKA